MSRYLVNRVGQFPEGIMMPDGDGRRTDVLSYLFEFRLVPFEKAGQPDEARYEERRQIEVRAGGECMPHLVAMHPEISDVKDATSRLLYWFAIEALENGNGLVELILDRMTITLDHPYPPIDLSRVVIHQGPFKLDLPDPPMGFHAVSQNRGR